MTSNSSVNTEKSLTEISVFENSEFGKVRIVTIDNEPYFVGKDVAVSLGYAKPENAIANHVDSEDKTTTLIQGDGSNYKSKTTIINESGLYSLILSSKLPTAKKFKHWVTSEVLPSIRKTGTYNIVQPKVDERLIALEEKKAGLERAKLLHNLAEEYNGNSKTWKQILDAHATKELTGEFLLPLPEVTEHGKTAEMIGKSYGLSCQKVGAIAKKLGITKTDDNGFTRVNKAKNCNREIETFYYNEIAEKKIVQAIEKELEECQKK